MAIPIVVVKVNIQIAPAPSTLQRTGALVSQGGTTLGANQTVYLTAASGLTAILTPSIQISTVAWNSNVVTVTTTTAHGVPNGDAVSIVIAGCSPTGYNGTFTGTSTGADTITYPLTTNPGNATAEGTFTLGSAVEIQQMVTTYFAQGTGNGVYILELGVNTPAAGITALTAYIALPPTMPFYGYLVPREWGSLTAMETLAALYAADNAMTYFWVTTPYADLSMWTVKSVVPWVEASAASISPTEFSAAANFATTLGYNPNPINKVTPNCYTYLQGVTAYDGTVAQQEAILAAHASFVGTGAEGGISNTLVQGGTTADGNDFTYWYSVDWTQININQALANAVINGSNNSINPLYYNQAGINTLEQVAQGVVNTGIAVGLILAPATVDAIPFTTYIAQEPTNYSHGIYGGLSLPYTPARGFTQIIFNIEVINLPTA